jgi:hypothetical protein
MATFYTVGPENGKYEFDVSEDTGLMLAARRHGTFWSPGFEERHSKCFMAALWRIHELELSDAREGTDRL